jgi:alpha-D-glucose phosphate-specific phosphoglucomutase
MIPVTKSIIKFGTDGWRGVIAEDFTFDNVRICAQGVASYHKSLGIESSPIVVGYDTRFGSEAFAYAVAEVLSANQIPTLLCGSATPTPVVSWNVLSHQAAGGIIITASHNPSQWNGFKYRTAYGGSPSSEIITTLEQEIAMLTRSGNDPTNEALTDESTPITHINGKDSYIPHLETITDLGMIRDAGLSLVIDVMHGAGAGFLGPLLSGGSTKTRELRSQRNPAFPGMHNPEPIASNLAMLSTVVSNSRADLGLALDGDADRLGVVDGDGNYITSLQIFALLAYYLLEVRRVKGPIIKSVTVGQMVFKLAQIYDVPIFETGVGFKHIAPMMVAENAILGGEESGGYAFRGHIPERDGIVSGILLLDLIARTGKSLSALLKELCNRIGPHHYDRIDIKFESERRQDLTSRLQNCQPKVLGDKRVTKVDSIDGVRFHLEDGSWVMLRFSGTEPLLRIYAEAESIEHVKKILRDAQDFAGI